MYTFLAGIFGRIDNPYKGAYSNDVADNAGFGMIIFFNNILKLVIVVAGIFAFLQFLTAGFQFISAGGDSKAVASAWNKIWQAALGLAIVAVSFVLAAIFGYLIFGDPRAILAPQIYGPMP